MSVNNAEFQKGVIEALDQLGRIFPITGPFWSVSQTLAEDWEKGEGLPSNSNVTEFSREKMLTAFGQLISQKSDLQLRA